MRRILMIVVGLPAFLSAASAQEPLQLAAPLCSAAVEAGCQCAVPLPSALGGNLAQVTNMNGTVLISREAGFSDAAQDAALTAADRVVTGENSGADLLVARSCALSVPAQSIVSFSEVEGCACAMLTTNEGEVGAQLGGPQTGNRNGVVGAAAFGSVLFTTGAALGDNLSDDDGDESPEEPPVN